MSPTPLTPLRWYEHLLLRLLAQSPRIARIIVFQDVYEDGAPPLSPNTFNLFVNQLERTYNSPPAPSPGPD